MDIIKAIFITLTLLILSILPIYNFYGLTKPLLIWLWAIYIQYNFTRYNGFISILFFGLCLDILVQSPLLGEQALAIFIIMWLAALKQHNFLRWQAAQQMLWVFVLIFSAQIILAIINTYIGYPVHWIYILGCVISTTILWPLFSKFISKCFLYNPYYKYNQNNIF